MSSSDYHSNSRNSTLKPSHSTSTLNSRNTYNRSSFDSQDDPSYMDMLTVPGEDWLDTYTDYNASKVDKRKSKQTKGIEKTNRRTTFQSTQSEKHPVTVRKTRSLRDNSRLKLRSPPPPPKIAQPESVDELPSMPNKKHSFQLINKANNNEPRKVLSSSMLNNQKISTIQHPTNALSDYQGYTRQSRHRSFTYSPPPPPRTSSLNSLSVPEVPPVPPVPPVPKIHSSQLKSKKSDGAISRPASNIGSNQYYPTIEPTPLQSENDIVKLQKELQCIMSPLEDSKLLSPSLTPSTLNRSSNLTSSTTDYAINLNHDLAQIEEDIKALEIERDRHSAFISSMELQKLKDFENTKEQEPVKTIGRKRGKTLPGSLATPPPIPTINLPPMTLNPIQITIPNNLQKKSSPVPPTNPTLRQSTSTTSYSKIKLSLLSTLDDHVEKLFKHEPKDPGMGLGSGIKTKVLDKKLSLPNMKRKSHNPTQPIPQNVQVKRTASIKQISIEHMKLNDEKPRAMYHSNHLLQPQQEFHEPRRSPTYEDNNGGGRSPKSVQTTLKYYGPYLSDYERQFEIHDYHHIYFVGPHAKKYGTLKSEAFNYGFDDERGDYKIVTQDHLAYRYEAIEVLGRGSFGQVVKCFDHKMNQMVAIKLIRNKKRFHAQAITEVNILKKLVEWDPDDQYCTIKMTDHFYFRNHLCIAFECLCMNLYEFIKNNHFQGFSTGLIKRITYQILQSLTLLAEHDVIHCDLKPENIMLKYPGKSSIKVIDFGSSCFESERVYTYIQSRFYRSPEVILGISYHKAIDMWSLGCIIAELYTGIPIFPGENEQEQLSCIMEIIGIPDRYIIERSSRRKLFFDSMGNPRIVPNSKGKKRIPGTKSLFQTLKCHDAMFIDFIERCLRWDPSRRMTPHEALQHEWITTNSRVNTPVTPVFLPHSNMAHVSPSYH